METTKINEPIEDIKQFREEVNVKKKYFKNHKKLSNNQLRKYKK